MDIMDAAIASPHWEACNTCKYHGDNGCIISHIDLSVYLGDWIICDDYENNKSIADRSPVEYGRGAKRPTDRAHTGLSSTNQYHE